MDEGLDVSKAKAKGARGISYRGKYTTMGETIHMARVNLKDLGHLRGAKEAGYGSGLPPLLAPINRFSEQEQVIATPLLPSL